MIVTNTLAFAPEAPAIDVSEARWANEELAMLIAKLGHDSPVSLVLRQARREITSLLPSPAATVIGPFRTAA